MSSASDETQQPNPTKGGRSSFVLIDLCGERADATAHTAVKILAKATTIEMKRIADREEEDKEPKGRVSAAGSGAAAVGALSSKKSKEDEGASDTEEGLGRRSNSKASNKSGTSPTLQGTHVLSISAEDDDDPKPLRGATRSRSSSVASLGSRRQSTASIKSLEEKGDYEGQRITKSGSIVHTEGGGGDGDDTPEGGVVLFPALNNKENKSYTWKDCLEVYPQQEEDGGFIEPLLPEDLGPEDIEQGAHPDCFFLTACALAAHHPEVIRNLFVSHEWPEEGQPFKLRFWRWNRWQEVHVDSQIPVEEGGAPSKGGKDEVELQPVFCRSPTKRVWPLILEKGYAAYYGGYEGALVGANIAESLHDLSGGRPVLNVCFDPAVVQNLNWSLNPLKDASFWTDLQNRVYNTADPASSFRFGMAVAAAANNGGSASSGDSVIVSAQANPNIPASALGLRKGHIYGVLGVYFLSRGVPDLDGFVVKLLCPYKEDEYVGPLSKKTATNDWKRYDETALRAHGLIKDGYKYFTAAQTPVMRNGFKTFFMPLKNFLEYFGFMQICRLEIGHSTGASSPNFRTSSYEKVHLPFSFSKREDTAGGRINFASWRKNPAFVVRNTTGRDIEIFCTVQQPERRTLENRKRKGEETYHRAGIALVDIGTKKRSAEGKEEWVPLNRVTPLRTAANCRVLQKPFYFNQRETTTRIKIPAEVPLSYLVPSTYSPGEETDILLSVDIPKTVKKQTGQFSVAPFPSPFFVAGSEKTTPPPFKEVWEVAEGKTTFFKLKVQAKEIVSNTASTVGVHILVSQQQMAASNKKVIVSGGEPEADTITKHFLTLEVQTQATHERVAWLPAATNYRELALVFDAPIKSGEKHCDLIVVATCPKGEGSVKCDLSVQFENHPNINNSSTNGSGAADSSSNSNEDIVAVDMENCSFTPVKVQAPQTVNSSGGGSMQAKAMPASPASGGPKKVSAVPVGKKAPAAAAPSPPTAITSKTTTTTSAGGNKGGASGAPPPPAAAKKVPTAPTTRKPSDAGGGRPNNASDIKKGAPSVSTGKGKSVATSSTTKSAPAPPSKKGASKVPGRK